MNIGTLTGQITLEDQLTGKLTMMAVKVQQFVSSSNSAFSSMAIGVGLVTGAVAGAVASIIGLGSKGSIILGVEESFDRLARAAGSTGDALVGALSEGVRHTIDSMVLMQSTTRLLSSGIKLSTDDMKLMGSVAREMGKATGTDAASGLNVLSQALLTGNQRSLKRYGIQVDLVRAEEKFASSLGTTRDQLNSAGKLEAARMAILDGMRTKLNTLGESQLSFRERIQQSQVAIGNWFDNLAKGVAGSSAVLNAFDAIQTSLVATFGGNTQSLLQWILGWVDSFANGVARIGPSIIEWIGRVRDRVVEIWNSLVDFNERWQITSTLVTAAKGAWNLLQGAFNLVRTAVIAVINAWQTMPDWLQRITKSALEATLVMGVYSMALGAASTPLRSLVETMDLGINIVGNFTGAIFNITHMKSQWAFMTDRVSKAYTALTAATVGSTLATNASTAASNFWNTTAVVSGARLAANTALTYAASVAARVATVAKTALAAALALVGSSSAVAGARMAAGTAATLAASAASKAAAAGMIALGTAINLVTFAVTKLLLPLGALLVGYKLGTWLEQNTKWARELSDAFQYAALRVMGFSAAEADAAIASHHAADALQRERQAVDDLAASKAQQAAEDAKRRREHLTGVDTATAVHELRMDYLALNAEQQKSEVTMNRVGAAASALRQQGGRLHPELKTLADRYDELNRISPTTTTNFLKTGDSAGKAAEKLRAYREELDQMIAVYTGQSLAAEVKKVNDAIARGGGLSKIGADGLKILGQQAEELSNKGAKLTGDIARVWVQQEMWVAGMPKAQVGIRGITDNLKDLWPTVQKNHVSMVGMSGIVSKIGGIDLPTFGYQVRNGKLELIRFGEAVDLVPPKTLKMRDAIYGIADALNNVFRNINSKIGQMMQMATSAIMQIAKKGANLGEQLAAGFSAAAGMLATMLGDSAGKFGQAAIGGLSGAAAGASIGFMFGGPMGAGIGAAIGGAAGALMGWVGAQKKAREADQAATAQIREYQSELIKTHGSLSNISVMGRLVGVDLAGAWGDRSRKGLENFKTLMDQFHEKLGKLKDALDEFGMSWKDLGQEARQMNIALAADTLLEKFKLITGAGATTERTITGMSGALNQLIIDAVDTGTKIPPAMQPILQQMIQMGLLTDEAAKAMLGLRDTSMPSLADIKAAADRYGISLDSLGPKVKQLQITELANQYVADWKVLSAATDNWSVLIKKMGPEVQSLVLDAIKYGAELPSNMRPMIQAFIDAGALVDENGEKLTDLSKLTFAADLSKMFDQLMTKLGELIDTIANGVGGALADIGNTNVPTITIPYQFAAQNSIRDPNEELEIVGPAYHATGGRVAGTKVLQFEPRGTDVVPAMLTPGERVLTVAENREYERSQAPTQTVNNYYISNDWNMKTDVDEKKLISIFKKSVSDNVAGARTEIREELGIAG